MTPKLEMKGSNNDKKKKRREIFIVLSYRTAV